MVFCERVCLVMIDPRVRVLILLGLSVAHAAASTKGIPLLLLVTLIVCLTNRSSVARGAGIMIMTAAGLGVFILFVWLAGNTVSVPELVSGYLRWVSLAVVSTTLFLSINAFEIITSLVYFRMPLGVAMAVGVGLRFLPTFIEEAQRTRVVRLHRSGGKSGLGGNLLSPVKVLGGILSPLVVSVLRRVDFLLLSITVQELEGRVRAFSHPPLKARDWMAVVLLVATLVFSIYY